MSKHSASAEILVDPTRWPLIFTLLSMDVVVPFYELMGLRVSAPNSLRDLIRSEILQTRRKFTSGPPGNAAYAPQETLDILEAHGVCQRGFLSRWGQRVFAWDLQEHRNLRLWDAVLRDCIGDAGKWRQLCIPERLADAARQQFLRAIDREAYDTLHAEICRNPLSDWDLHMYAVNLFDDEDPAIPTGPSTYVYPTFKNYQGYSFWTWLNHQSTPSEQETLRRNATNIAQRVVALSHVGELPSPSQLETGL